MKFTQKLFVFAICVLGCVTCQNSNDLDVNDLGDLEKKLHENGVPESFNSNATEQVEKVFREKCEQNGAGDVVDSLKNQQENLKECFGQHVNVTVLQEELEVAKQTGSMDEVFGKYCRKWPEIYKCVENVTDQVRLCMNEDEKKAFNKSLDILLQLEEFMCFKDGDRLAMFVAEGGVACMTERQEEVKQCINSTVGDRLPASTDELSITNLPTFLFSDKDCQDFDKIRVCVNQELEKCKDSTPANIIDAFFKFLKKQMPCQSVAVPLKGEEATSQTVSNSLRTSFNVILLGLPVLLSMILFWSH